jgi:hypothetical protein
VLCTTGLATNASKPTHGLSSSPQSVKHILLDVIFCSSKCRSINLLHVPRRFYCDRSDYHRGIEHSSCMLAIPIDIDVPDPGPFYRHERWLARNSTLSICPADRILASMRAPTGGNDWNYRAYTRRQYRIGTVAFLQCSVPRSPHALAALIRGAMAGTFSRGSTVGKTNWNHLTPSRHFPATKDAHKTRVYAATQIRGSCFFRAPVEGSREKRGQFRPGSPPSLRTLDQDKKISPPHSPTKMDITV